MQGRVSDCQEVCVVVYFPADPLKLAERPFLVSGTGEVRTLCIARISLEFYS